MSLAITTTSPRLIRATVIGLACLALALGMALAAPPSHGSHATPQGPITAELLSGRAEFTDAVTGQLRVKLDGQGTRVLNMKDPSRTIVARITVPAGAHFPWHTHPGPVVVNVTQGELVYQNASDCVERRYPTDTAFIDPGRGNVHTAWNPTDGTTVLVATFFEVPATGLLTIPAEEGDC